MKAMYIVKDIKRGGDKMKFLKKAEAYIDSVVTVFLSVLILYVCSTLFYTLVNYQKIDTAANQIINQAALNGEVNSPGFQDKCVQIIKSNNLDPKTVDISFANSEFLNNGAGKSTLKQVQFGKNISLTLAKEAGFTYLGNKNHMVLSISVTKNKLSEKYWNDKSKLTAEGIIPSGGNYTSINGNSLTSGKLFPTVMKPGDIYKYADYEYTYHNYGWKVRAIDTGKNEYGEILSWINRAPVVSMEGTFTNCRNLVKAPSVPDTVKNLSHSFSHTKITQAPVIPRGVTNMQFAFEGCELLTNGPKIPDTVTNMDGTFSQCKKLTTAPYLPNSVTQMRFIFYGCVELKESPAIPIGVKDLTSAFENTKITKTPYIPNGVLNMTSTFANCRFLQELNNIPNTVTALDKTFMHCYMLKNVPEIPSSVLTMQETFENCNALSGNIKINANLENQSKCNLCFANTQNQIHLIQGNNVQDITITHLLLSATHGNVLAEGYVPHGAKYFSYKTQQTINYGYKMPKYSQNEDAYTAEEYTYFYSASEKGWSVNIWIPDKAKRKIFSPILESINGAKVKIMDKTFEDCTSLTVAPEIPVSVFSMKNTFGGCTSLVEAPDIPNGVIYMDATFYGCTSLTEVPIIPISVKNMDSTFDGCKSLMKAPIIPTDVVSMVSTFKGCTSLKGTVIINANPNFYNGCFEGAGSSAGCIRLTGLSTKLQEFAATNKNGYVIVAQ